MELTKTEILKQINDIKSKHDSLKQESIDLIKLIKESEEKINANLTQIDELEVIYVDLIEKLAE